MLSIITSTQDPLLAYVRDDPVRPELGWEFRVAPNRFVSVLQDRTPQAIVCVSLHDFVPESVVDLDRTALQANTAIFYTIWSYAPGSGASVLTETVGWIKQHFPEIQRFVTLSPKTEMAKKFHLRNGAEIFRENATTVNYEYKL